MAANNTPTNNSSLQVVHHSVKMNKSQRQRLQHMLNYNPSDGWKRCWEEGVTPWDLGKPVPILQHLHETNALPKGKALVPGCGSGYNVMALATPERYVVGLDISEAAINKAKELVLSSPNANYFSFLQADFFTWEPTELFDVICDHQFFCAIVPELRPAWAACMARLLKPDGELITIMFMIGDYDDVGHEPPPYKTSVDDYEEVLTPLGFYAVSIGENELALSHRKGEAGEVAKDGNDVYTMSAL